MSRHNEMPSARSANRGHLANLGGSCLQGDDSKKLSVAFSVLTARLAGELRLSDNQIDHISSAAICEEIGDRLRTNLTGQSVRLPQHMMMVVEQMAQNDHVSAVLSDTSKPQ
jgi:hypothetical protein